MPPLLIAAITPDEPGFSALRAESQQLRAGRIRHLYIGERHRRQGIGHQLLVSVITHSGASFDFLNTHAPSTAWSFYENLGFRPVHDEPRVTHRLFCSL